MTQDIRPFEIDSIQNLLFLGIGGIGMSAVAKYFLNKGTKVSGYDRTPSEITEELSKMGAHIFFEDGLSTIGEDFDAVIYTPAIPKNSLLLNHYRNSKIPILKRSEILGWITQSNYTITVAGSHGKTTISTMITYLLRSSGIDCSAFLGGVSVNYSSNYVHGKSNVVVVEADEFDRSFMTLSPDISIITSIDLDHLDIYGSRDKLVAAFQEFADLTNKEGIIILNEKLEQDIQTDVKKIIYGFGEVDFYAKNLSIFPTYSTFRLGKSSKEYKLNYNSRHNVENALAAIAVGYCLNISEDKLSKALENFRGIKRRFELIYEDKNTIFIDDYAHHPAEIEALLTSIKEVFPNKKVLSIFQPHLFSRTKDLAEDFARSLDISDEIIILPIYPARELPIEGVTSYNISDRMAKTAEIVDKEGLINSLKQRNFEVILTIGAGDISHCISDIKNHLSSR